MAMVVATGRRSDNDDPSNAVDIDWGNFQSSIIPAPSVSIGLGTSVYPWTGVSSTALTLSAGGAGTKYQQFVATTPALSNTVVTFPDPGQNVANIVYDINLPSQCTMWGDEFAISGDVGTLGSNTSQRYNAYQGTTVQNANWFGRFFLQAASPYTMHVLGISNSSFGKMIWSVDNIVQGNTDFYSASAGFNFTSTLSVNVLTSGAHTLTGVVSTKNASSTGYAVQISKIWFT
jgi:hypothetical protein